MKRLIGRLLTVTTMLTIAVTTASSQAVTKEPPDYTAAQPGQAAWAPFRLTPVAAYAPNSLPGSPASNAIDGNSNTIWSAGATAPQWLRVDLGTAVLLSSIRLLTEQSPPGITTHVIEASKDDKEYDLVARMRGQTTGAQWISVNMPSSKPYRYIRITTEESPSWVAWREVEVYSQLEPLPARIAASSGTYGNNVPQRAVDGDLATAWVSGGFAPQYLVPDIGRAVPMRLSMVVEQAPPGLTLHVIEGSMSSATDGFVELARIQQVTQGGEVLDVPLASWGAYRFLRVRTLQSPSWVAWREISVFGRTLQRITPREAAACATYGSNVPMNAFDGSLQTGFNSGVFAPCYLSADLGNSYHVALLLLHVDQVPGGPASHVISVGPNPGTTQTLTVEGTFTGGDIIPVFVSPETPIRYLRIDTKANTSWVAWREIEVYGFPETRPCQPPRPREIPPFYGYFMSSTNAYGDYTAEVSGHANMTFIADTAWDTVRPGFDTSGDVRRLSEASRLGIKAVLYLTGLFFQANPVTKRLDLAAQYQQNWTRYADAVAPYKDNILAFYPLDEPFANGATLAQLENVYGLLKQRFANIPVATIFNWSEVDAGLTMPHNLDWVGFDCYGSWESCSGKSGPQRIQLLRSRMLSGQHLFLVPDAFLYLPHGTAATQSTIEDRLALEYTAEQYFRTAAVDNTIIGLMPFLWQRVSGAQLDIVGIRELGINTQTRYAEFAGCLIGNR